MRQDEVQADALLDLRTSANELSVWRVGDEADCLSRATVALALQRQSLQEYDFGLFTEDAVRALDIELCNTEGNTADPEFNNRHVDLVKLTARKVADLAALIRREQNIKRHTFATIKADTKKLIEDGHINIDRLNPEIRKSLQKYNLL